MRQTVESVGVPGRQGRERRGNSDTQMRIELLEKYVKCFGSQSIEYVTGDREFIGIEWIGYLQEQGIESKKMP